MHKYIIFLFSFWLKMYDFVILYYVTYVAPT
jgi:hypothetical protein